MARRSAPGAREGGAEPLRGMPVEKPWRGGWEDPGWLPTPVELTALREACEEDEVFFWVNM